MHHCYNWFAYINWFFNRKQRCLPSRYKCHRTTELRCRQRGGKSLPPHIVIYGKQLRKFGETLCAKIEGTLLCPRFLCIYQFIVYNLYSSVSDTVHPNNPFHLINGFELFGYALTLCHLFYKSRKLVNTLQSF